MTIAVLPASFDPITRGHVDIATRAAALFERLVVAVYSRPRKNVVFPLEERLEMVGESLHHLANLEIVAYDGLTVDLCRGLGATVLIRGLRSAGDFEYEYQQATLNRYMLPGLEVVSIFAAPEYAALSSSMVKEIAENGGDVSWMVPEAVARRITAQVDERADSPTSKEVLPSTF